MGVGRTEVGLVGCGRWGRLILRDLVALGCDVTVVSGTEADQARAREAGARNVVDDLSALPAVAGVVVAVPVSAHADVVERVLPLGVPVFCEKPLTNDAARAAQLARAGEGRLFIMDKWRYHPGIRRLAEIARTEALGKVVGLRTTRVQPGCAYTDVDAVWILAPHDLSIAIEVLGYVPEPRTAVVEHDGTAIVGLVGVLGTAPWMVVEVSARYGEHRREVRLSCEGGTAILADAYATDVLVLRGAPMGVTPPPVERLPVGDAMPLLEELRAFIEHVHGGPPPKSGAGEGAAVVDAISRLRALAGHPPRTSTA